MESSKNPASVVGKLLSKIKVPLILLLIAIVAFLGYKRYTVVKRAANLENMAKNKESTLVEKRDLMSTIATTGTIISESKRTVSAALSNTKVEHVNVEVGDYVEAGDVIVSFTMDSINRSISDLEADIAESKSVQQIDSGGNEREYYYSYGTEAITIKELQTKVERAQKTLYEACDEYGSLKRDKQAKIDSHELTEEQADELYKDKIAAAYKAQETAQQNLADANQALQNEIYKGSNTLANSTDTYNKNNLQASDSTNKLERELRDYKEKLSDYKIVAPVSGLVTSVNVQEGNGFTSGTIATIQNTDSYFVTTEIDEYDIPEVKLGQRVVIKTDATRDTELEGIVDEIAPTATGSESTNSTTTTSTSSAASSSASDATYTVKIKIIDVDERLKLGMTAKLSIVLEERSGVLTVPYDAIYENEAGESFIYVYDDSDKKVVIPNSGTKAAAPEEKKGFSFSEFFGLGSDNKKELEDLMPEKKEVAVTVGMESDYYTEISGNGIKEGLEVALPETEAKAELTFEDLANQRGGGPGGGGPR
ncbi:MAG: efflux RND transporter periplasmic adaptor subunit [Lachnospiraceae bacterium]|nr:efflux RND transporter periplasmic adaptor subunit [Lachnospiraceae bacterium]